MTTISKSVNGFVLKANGRLSITSTGSILDPGLSAYGGSVIRNGGFIFGSQKAVDEHSGPITLTNQGNIGGMIGQYSVYGIANATGIIVNDGIVLGQTAILGGSENLSVSNLGTIIGEQAANAHGVSLTASGRVTNGSSSVHSSIISGRSSGIQAHDSATSIENSAIIAGAIGVLLDNGGRVVNQANGLIEGPFAAVSAGYKEGGSATVINNGVLRGTPAYGTTFKSDGVELLDGGRITNGAGGVIEGVAHGVSLGQAQGIFSGPQSAVVDVTNLGTIESGASTIAGAAGILTSVGGKVINGSSSVRTALIKGPTGVLAEAGSAVAITNFGTIQGYDGVSIDLGDPADRLVLEARSVEVGSVVGGGGMLELGSAAGVGQIGGLGLDISGFSRIQIDAGATWRLIGANTIASGEVMAMRSSVSEAGTLLNQGSIWAQVGIVLKSGSELNNAVGAKLVLLDNAWITSATGASSTSLVNAGVLQSKGVGTNLVRVDVSNTGAIEATEGTLHITGTVSGSGKVTIGDATAYFAAPFSEQVTFTPGSTGTLELAHSQDFSARIIGFSTKGANALDLRDIRFSSTRTKATFKGSKNSGLLTVTDGTHTAKIRLQGDYTNSTFTLSSDGHGGTKLVDPSGTGSALSSFTAAIATFAPAPASPGGSLDRKALAAEPMIARPA